MTAADLAARVGVSLPTLRKVETVDPGVSMGVFATALWVLGLLDAMREAIGPEADRLGTALDLGRLPKRVRSGGDRGLEGL